MGGITMLMTRALWTPTNPFDRTNAGMGLQMRGGEGRHLKDAEVHHQKDTEVHHQKEEEARHQKAEEVRHQKAEEVHRLRTGKGPVDHLLTMRKEEWQMRDLKIDSDHRLMAIEDLRHLVGLLGSPWTEVKDPEGCPDLMMWRKFQMQSFVMSNSFWKDLVMNLTSKVIIFAALYLYRIVHSM